MSQATVEAGVDGDVVYFLAVLEEIQE